MLVNPDKFQAIIINPKRSDNPFHTLKIGEYEIQTQSSVELVGIEIDDHLFFTNHMIDFKIRGMFQSQNHENAKSVKIIK